MSMGCPKSAATLGNSNQSRKPLWKSRQTTFKWSLIVSSSLLDNTVGLPGGATGCFLQLRLRVASGILYIFPACLRDSHFHFMSNLALLIRSSLSGDSLLFFLYTLAILVLSDITMVFGFIWNKEPIFIHTLKENTTHQFMAPFLTTNHYHFWLNGKWQDFLPAWYKTPLWSRTS